MKSATAQEEDKWGNYSVVTFRTLSKRKSRTWFLCRFTAVIIFKILFFITACNIYIWIKLFLVPKHPPRTDIGSFEVVENNNNRDIYLYWQMISAKEENGENFHYTVITIEEKGRRVRAWPNETTKTYAKFKGLSFNNYKFEIASVNNVGQTKQTARIFVPSRSDRKKIINFLIKIIYCHFQTRTITFRNVKNINNFISINYYRGFFLNIFINIHLGTLLICILNFVFIEPAEPIAFTKIAFDKGLYELSWKVPPKTNNEVKNYTIFWCDNDRDRPYQCTVRFIKIFNTTFLLTFLKYINYMNLFCFIFSGIL